MKTRAPNVPMPPQMDWPYVLRPPMMQEAVWYAQTIQQVVEEQLQERAKARFLQRPKWVKP